MDRKYKIVILERNSVGSDVSVSMFEKLGDVTVYETTAPDEIAGRVKDADIVLINKSPINELTIGAAPNIKLVGEFATGYDNVDINYCKSRGIAVTNVRGYSTSAVVQHTFALALYVTEHLKYYDEYVKSGEYEKSGFFTHYGQTFTELSGKTWGIIGMGNIGRGVAKVAESFGCNVIWSSASGTVRDEGYKYAELDELLSTADIISLHCPLNEKTKYLINKETLSNMKKTAVLINVARGPVVNNSDLYEALENNVIAGAGLDVLDGEPITPDNPLKKFKDSNRLIITPHMAWASTEARTRCVEEAYKNTESFINGQDRCRVI